MGHAMLMPLVGAHPLVLKASPAWPPASSCEPARRVWRGSCFDLLFHAQLQCISAWMGRRRGCLRRRDGLRVQHRPAQAVPGPPWLCWKSRAEQRLVPDHFSWLLCNRCSLNVLRPWSGSSLLPTAEQPFATDNSQQVKPDSFAVAVLQARCAAVCIVIEGSAGVRKGAPVAQHAYTFA